MNESNEKILRIKELGTNQKIIFSKNKKSEIYFNPTVNHAYY